MQETSHRTIKKETQGTTYKIIMSLIENNSSGTTGVSMNYKHKQLILYFLCSKNY